MKRTAGHTPRLPVIGELRDTEHLDTRSYDMRAEGIRLANQRISDPADLQCEECEFDHVTFEGSGRGSRFTDVIFRNCDFSAAVFDESGFCRCLFESCRLSGTSLVRASFRDVTIRESVMDYANISASSLNSVRMEHCRLAEAAIAMCTLKQTVFKECDLSRCELADTKLAGIDLSDCDISGIMVKPSDLKDVAVNRDQAVVFAALLGIRVTD
jgi:uncharacterized protein YjbI with pentapeptide repeats